MPIIPSSLIFLKPNASWIYNIKILIKLNLRIYAVVSICGMKQKKLNKLNLMMNANDTHICICIFTFVNIFWICYILVFLTYRWHFSCCFVGM